MIRSQKVHIRPVYNQSSTYETNQSSTNITDIQSYIGKILTINYNQFIVEDILGQGGFAFVFLVRSFNQQRYALKRMYVNNQRDLHVCQREISIIKEFSSHPNIVKYVDSSIQRLSSTNIQTRHYYTAYNENNNNDDDDAIYEIFLLTEYCSNGALITRLNEQRNVGITLNERQILRIFADICLAISACHFRRPQPILHRDIKLENILIDSQQNYVLCDFGSAIMLPSSTTNDHRQYQKNELTTNIIQQLEEEIQRYTTLSYRAPEMIDLYSRLPLTLKIDIWAMGCLLYKLMYNIMPFGDSILAIQNGTFVIPDDMAQNYSRELNLFVRYMLEIDIDKRPDIWQVSYITYKLLGSECPISNRCQSKIPNLNIISMPLTDSEYRHQRTTALSKTKTTSKNITDEFLSLGTAVNPRERPRGMMTPSTSLINFDQPNQQSSTTIAPPNPSTNSSRSGSATQLMFFDDDFSQIPSHAISLTNIPNVTAATTTTTTTTTAKNEKIIPRARPLPSEIVSTASGLTLQQQHFLPPPPSSNIQTHRRSASQTTSPTNIQSSFHKASSVDSSNEDEVFDDDDINPLKTNLNKLKLKNSSIINSQLNSDDKSNRNIKKKSQLPITTKSTSHHHHPSTEEAEKDISFSNTNNKNFIESQLIEHSINQTSNENNLNNNNTKNNFFQVINKDSDDEQEINQKIDLIYHSSTLNKHNNLINSSLIDNNNNPFLCAPFHHSSNKQTSTSSSTNINQNITTTNSTSCDLNSIVVGKRTSAFAPYQKREINSDNHVIDIKYDPGSSIEKVPHSESFASNVLNNQSTDVFTNAPFKTKSKSKQRSIVTNSEISSNSQLIDINVQEQLNKKLNPNKKPMIIDIDPEQYGYSNLSFNDTITDEHL
ncbi:unnamed protein product [Rotaria sordida]|uniref:non-specific serine/threonine protein kinase n=1 Tax=Rotaria sordida TaxID=392033 RepID=A0A819H132_9BILA|nr:unnamed protein product [Rotaria sordida]